MADREPRVDTLVATRCHNRPQNAKRPTTLGVSLSYNPVVSRFRKGGFKLREPSRLRTNKQRHFLTRAFITRTEG